MTEFEHIKADIEEGMAELVRAEGAYQRFMSERASKFSGFRCKRGHYVAEQNGSGELVSGGNKSAL